MGDSWNKKLEVWVEEMRIVEAEAKKPGGAENESVEQLSYLPAKSSCASVCCCSLEGSRLRSLMERTVLTKSCKSVTEIKLSMKQDSPLEDRVRSTTRAHHLDQLLQG